MAEITFLIQQEPVDELGRALYAVTRSVIRALLDQLGQEDLVGLQKDWTPPLQKHSPCSLSA